MPVGEHDLLSFLPRSVLLPPILLLMAALVCWGVAWRYPKAGLRLVGVCLLLLLVLALPITPALMFNALESGILLTRPPSPESRPQVDPLAVVVPPAAAASPPMAALLTRSPPTAELLTRSPAVPALPRAIVILGADGSFGRVGGAIFGGAQPGSLSLERLRAGAALQRRTNLPILLTGGALNPGSIPISVLMRQSLQDDFKAQAQWVEPRSADTWENAEFTAAILAREGITSVYVVTHSWHMRRALIAFHHFGITVWPAPVSLAAYEGIKLEMFQPSVTAWLDSYFAMHEWVGCAVYSIRSGAFWGAAG